MKELSDNEFDKLLKQKADAYDFDFDESAWNKMEQKLRRRDRLIFIRNSSVVVLLFILFGGGYLMLNNTDSTSPKPKLGKTKTTIDSSIVPLFPIESKKMREVGFSDKHAADNSKKTSATHYQFGTGNKSVQQDLQTKNKDFEIVNSHSITDNYSVKQPDLPAQNLFRNSLTQSAKNTDSLLVLTANSPIDSGAISAEQPILISKKSKRLTLSLTLLAGPEFSSVKSQGGKGSINTGLLLNVGVSDKISFSSGLRYGVKNYLASSSDYKTQNPVRALYLSGIDASCNILEIPFLISYALINDSHKKIQVTSGLSSYLMLKEKYDFKYNPQSGYTNYTLVKNNANQHYFGVLNLAASYQIKSKSSGLQWAIEPYLKLPLGGVGEGNVRLKSTGISLNLLYDIRKKK
ncbi:MAG: hypothetical protein H7Y07_07430 [Pyrinomonadaceae bacterium]|nr:hypothetical protein [Sphingobacteriaceae bacterium]